MQAAYRPFDVRHTCYTGNSRGLYSSPQQYVMSQFIHGDNVGLCCIRICSRDDELPVFVTDKITDKTILSSKDNANVFPLWLYEENMGQVERRANLNPEIVARIAAAVTGTTGVSPVGKTGTTGVSPVDAARTNSSNPTGKMPVVPVNGQDARSPGALEIFDYVYAILHTPEYRAKYREFLKTDFPRVPYPKDGEMFRRFAAIGAQLRTTHLMKDPMPTLAERTAAFPVAGNNVVEAVRFDLTQRHRDTEINESGKNSEPLSLCVKNQCGRVYINDTQYFDNVAQEDFEFFIGGYQPAQKWLKDRKGRALTRDDLRHYQRIVLALRRTRLLESELSVLAKGGWN